MGGVDNKICTIGANGKNCYNDDDLQCDSLRCDVTCQNRLDDGGTCDENSDCVNSTCSGGICGGTGATVDLAVVKIEPVQVIKDVDLVEGKSGIIRVWVTNYDESNEANATVNVTFDGIELTIHESNTNNKVIFPNKNVSFDFSFNPTNSESNIEIIANVSVI